MLSKGIETNTRRAQEVTPTHTHMHPNTHTHTRIPSTGANNGGSVCLWSRAGLCWWQWEICRPSQDCCNPTFKVRLLFFFPSSLPNILLVCGCHRCVDSIFLFAEISWQRRTKAFWPAYKANRRKRHKSKKKQLIKCSFMCFNAFICWHFPLLYACACAFSPPPWLIPRFLWGISVTPCSAPLTEPFQKDGHKDQSSLTGTGPRAVAGSRSGPVTPAGSLCHLWYTLGLHHTSRDSSMLVWRGQCRRARSETSAVVSQRSQTHRSVYLCDLSLD